MGSLLVHVEPLGVHARAGPPTLARNASLRRSIRYSKPGRAYTRMKVTPWSRAKASMRFSSASKSFCSPTTKKMSITAACGNWTIVVTTQVWSSTNDLEDAVLAPAPGCPPASACRPCRAAAPAAASDGPSSSAPLTLRRHRARVVDVDGVDRAARRLQQQAGAGGVVSARERRSPATGAPSGCRCTRPRPACFWNSPAASGSGDAGDGQQPSRASTLAARRDDDLALTEGPGLLAQRLHLDREVAPRDAVVDLALPRR